ncbi:MAG: hypothetical protein ACRD0I_01150 [Acidimicrobiales bacterium]
MTSARSVRSLLALVLLSGLGFAACGGGASYSGTPAKTWLTSVCGALAGYQTQLASRTTSFETATKGFTSLDQARSGLQAYIHQAVQETDKVIGQVHSAGQPAVKDGSQIAGGLASGFSEVRAAFSQAEAQAGAISITSATAFEHSAQMISTELTNAANQAGTTFTNLDKKYPSPELSKNAKQVPACGTIFSTPPKQPAK